MVVPRIGISHIFWISRIKFLKSWQLSETATRDVLLKKVFLKISRNSQETPVPPLARVISWPFCELFMNTFFYTTPVVAAFGKFRLIKFKRISLKFIPPFLTVVQVDSNSPSRVKYIPRLQLNLCRLCMQKFKYILLKQTISLQIF